jgi:hypothetical protein
MKIARESRILLDIFTNKVALLVDKLEDDKSKLKEVGILIKRYNDGFIDFCEFAKELERVI